MKKPPYPGQGKSLPIVMSFSGEWIIEDQLFLFRQPYWKPQTQVTPFIQSKGRLCVGFPAEHIAALFGLSAAAVFELNRAHKLSVQYSPVPPRARGTVAQRFGFSDGNKLVEVIIEGGGDNGRVRGPHAGSHQEPEAAGPAFCDGYLSSPCRHCITPNACFILARAAAADLPVDLAPGASAGSTNELGSDLLATLERP